MLPEDLQPELPPPVQQAQETSTFKRERFAALAKQKAGLRIEGLKLYEPLPNQQQIHLSNSPQRVARGGNRCLGAETEIYDPVKGELRKVGEIDGPFNVYARDPATGQQVIADADTPFLKGIADLYRVTLSNGESFTCTLQHRVLTSDGFLPVGHSFERQQQSAAFHLPSSLDTCLLAFRQDDERSSRTLQDSLGGYRLDRHLCGGRLPLEACTCPEPSQQQGDAHVHTHYGLHVGVLGSEQGCIHPYQTSYLLSSQYALNQTLDPACAWQSHDACTPCLQPCRCDQEVSQSGQPSSVQLHTNDASGQSASQKAHSLQVSGGNSVDCLHITAVEYLREDAFFDFEVFVYHNYVHAGGIVSHNSGKTCSCAVEIARAATWADPHSKYPVRPLLIYLVGYDQDHIGRVFHRALFRPGLFKMIRDEATGEWRAFRPWTDNHREKEAKLSPPLIPARMVEEIAWVNKRERIFSVVRLKNGTEIRAFSSKSDPAQGDPVDLVWIDEDLFDDVWVTEMQARLSDRKGKLLWSAFPHSKNDALITLSQRARDPENLARPIPDVFETILVFSENPFMDEDQKRMRRADFASMSEEELNARDRGEFITESVLMYPAFNIQLHGAPHELDDPVPDNPFDRVLRETGQVPADWTRYVSIDPGHSICCCLFFAVPPPHRFGEHVLLYDELYIRQCTAGMFGRAMAERTSGHVFQSFVIDEHGSRVTEAGTGKTIKMQYAEELRRNRVESVATGSGFISGSDDRHGRSMMARTWMQIRDDGTTKFRVLKGRCPNFIRELPFYRKSVQDRLVLDVANPKTARLCHAMAAFEYMVAYQPQYKPPAKPKTHWSPAYAMFMADEQKANRGSQGIWLGAGSGRN